MCVKMRTFESERVNKVGVPEGISPQWGQGRGGSTGSRTGCNLAIAFLTYLNFVQDSY